MVVDPADTVCDNVSPLRDLKNRAEVQFQLWNNVYNLRNGKYYEATAIDFVANIDKCRISNVDNPDILYLSDEGVILRRLFAVFSFRPIVVQTLPVFGVILNNPLNLPVNTNVITSIPYITYKLPSVAVAGQQYALSDANNQMQFYMENGSFVPKATQIIDARGPIIFYVPRRVVALPIRVTNPQLTPFGFTELSNSTRHYHNINGIAVNYENTLSITKHIVNTNVTYYLRSAVALEKYNDTNIILGHMTYLFNYARDNNLNIIQGTDPTEINVYIPRRANLIASKGFPILATSDVEAKTVISTCGTIYIYSEN
jgi:hypothetical protein